MPGKPTPVPDEPLDYTELVDPDDETGVYIAYHGWDIREQWIKLRRVLSEEILEQATLEAAKAKLPNNQSNQRVFRQVLIERMVLDAQIKRRGGGYHPWTPATIKKLPVALRLWIANQADNCDGSVAGLAQVEIAGLVADFRETGGFVVKGLPARPSAPGAADDAVDGAGLGGDAAEL